MRILHVVQELRTGGAERVVLTLAEGTRQAGHQTAIAAAPGELAAEADGELFPVPMIQRKPWRVPSAAWSIAKAIRSWQPDVVHGHNPGMAAATALATRRGRRPPTLVTVHGVPDEDYAAAGRVLRLTGVPVVACGPGVAAALAERRVHVAETIVNGVTAPPPPADRSALEREFGLASGTPLLVSAGRLVEQKNHALAVQALAAIPAGVLLIFGEGPLRPELEDQVSELGLDGRAVLGGVRPDLRSVIGAADVLVVPSRWEGLPLVVLEALAAGTPVVATAVRGLSELLEGTSAILVPPDDPEALAHGVRRALADGSSHADSTLNRTYSAEAMVNGYLELYARISR